MTNFDQIEANLQESYTGVFKLGIGMDNYEWYEDENFVWLCSHVDAPFFNGVLSSKGKPEQIKKRIPEIINYFKNKNVPFYWRIHYGTEHKDMIASTVKEHGLKLYDNLTTAYAPLDKIDDKNVEEILSSYTIKRVNNRDDFEKWFIPCKEAFGIKDKIADFFYNFFLHIGFDENNIFPSHYLEVDGKPVACNSIYKTNGETAGVFNIAVTNNDRKKGYGKLIAMHAGYELKKMGYKYVGQFASTAGLPVYQKLGVEAINSYECYEWLC
jgi:hypothetical protein